MSMHKHCNNFSGITEFYGFRKVYLIIFNICDQLRHQYARWLNVFGRKKIEVITDYSYATAQRIATLLQFYTDLLKDADSYQLTLKNWSLIPMATHQMGIIYFLLYQTSCMKRTETFFHH
jgi:hypothetical protein